MLRRKSTRRYFLRSDNSVLIFEQLCQNACVDVLRTHFLEQLEAAVYEAADRVLFGQVRTEEECREVAAKIIQHLQEQLRAHPQLLSDNNGLQIEVDSPGGKRRVDVRISVS